MIVPRAPDSIHVERGRIEHGTFEGRWHFSFGDYHDPAEMGFGSLRVFNDDTLSPGAVWPLHPHREIEVVTYCAEGVFRHADEHGVGGVLREGWVQHTTVGRGMHHSEINDRPDAPMRFIQMWLRPRERGLAPHVEQRPVEPAERADRWLPLVSNEDAGALPVHQDARVLACRLAKGQRVSHDLRPRRDAYLYVVRGGPVSVEGHRIPALGAAKVLRQRALLVDADETAELLLVEVGDASAGPLH